MTNAELIAELRKPGKVYMPVISETDVIHIAVEKADVISVLKDRPAADEAAWTFYGNYADGRKLDVNS